MAYKGLRHFIEHIEAKGELVRINEPVSPNLQIAEIYDRVVKADGPALLFENTGTDFPVLINMMGSEARICAALGVNHLDDIGGDIEDLMKDLMAPRDNLVEKLKMLPKLGKLASWMPKVRSGRGACQEVVMDNPDLSKLPVLTCWPEDGGPFITFPIIHTLDPHTNIRNVGLYRMQVFGPDLTGMHWHRHKVSAGHFRLYKEMGKRMPVSVALGGDPVYTYAATAPMPENVDEYMLAGFLRKKKVELVKCLTNDLQVPADADIIIEGYVDPDEDYILEGPFGDHTGYYSLADMYPKFHVTAITHRKDAVYPATVVGIPPQEDGWIGKATERIFLAPIKMTLVPEIVDMELPVEGVFHNVTIANIDKTYPGQALKVANAMWGAGQMMLNKMLIVCDKDVNIHDYQEVIKAISKNVDPARDIFYSQGPMDVLDHSCSAMAFGGKMCVDATRKLPEEAPDGVVEQESPKEFDVAALQSAHPEIKAVNTSLIDNGIAALVIAVQKDRKGHIAALHESITDSQSIGNTRFVIYLDDTNDVSDLRDVVWRASNNMDARRDALVGTKVLGIDATMKTKKFDDFDRDWPNIIVMDEATIKQVDDMWDKLGLGPLLQSPSHKYRPQLYKGGAVVEE
jgi:4-hydroxy-3-polyprenylbenzoate decarboxylase